MPKKTEKQAALDALREAGCTVEEKGSGAYKNYVVTKGPLTCKFNRRGHTSEVYTLDGVLVVPPGDPMYGPDWPRFAERIIARITSPIEDFIEATRKSDAKKVASYQRRADVEKGRAAKAEAVFAKYVEPEDEDEPATVGQLAADFVEQFTNGNVTYVVDALHALPLTKVVAVTALFIHSLPDDAASRLANHLAREAAS
jgi:hypothetical protein